MCSGGPRPRCCGEEDVVVESVISSLWQICQGWDLRQGAAMLDLSIHEFERTSKADLWEVVSGKTVLDSIPTVNVIRAE